jgi:hypothetical protein
MNQREAEEAETMPLDELSRKVNFWIGQGMGHPLMPAAAIEALSAIGVLLARLASEVDKLKGEGAK